MVLIFLLFFSPHFSAFRTHFIFYLTKMLFNSRLCLVRFQLWSENQDDVNDCLKLQLNLQGLVELVLVSHPNVTNSPRVWRVWSLFPHHHQPRRLTVFVSPLAGKARCFFKEGDVVIVLTGWRPGSGYTNTMRVVLVAWATNRGHRLPQPPPPTLSFLLHQCTTPRPTAAAATTWGVRPSEQS